MSAPEPMFYIASLKHTNRGHEHIVWWAADSLGYTPVFGDQIGRYSARDASEMNDGVSCVSVPVEAVEALLAAEPYHVGDRGGNLRRFYDQRGRVVDNTAANWHAIIAAGAPRLCAKPKFELFRGRRLSQARDIPVLSAKEAQLLGVLERCKASRSEPLPAKSIARELWPQEWAERGTSRGRGGLYRSAGAFSSRLERKCLVGFWMDDFNRGYYATQLGREALAVHLAVAAQRQIQAQPAGEVA